MRKLKKNQQVRVQACKKKIETFLQNKILPSEDKKYLSDFNSEWSLLLKLFNNNMISLKNFEKKVSSLCSNWEEKLSNK